MSMLNEHVMVAVLKTTGPRNREEFWVAPTSMARLHKDCSVPQLFKCEIDLAGSVP